MRGIIVGCLIIILSLIIMLLYAFGFPIFSKKAKIEKVFDEEIEYLKHPQMVTRF